MLLSDADLASFEAANVKFSVYSITFPKGTRGQESLIRDLGSVLGTWMDPIKRPYYNRLNCFSRKNLKGF